jgi:hypothetical protein
MVISKESCHKNEMAFFSSKEPENTYWAAQKRPF